MIPVADIVFIHGLGGGSRKTWSFSPDCSHYWPQSWLPADQEFSDVRIHTFGYKADWGERRQSVLDIHDFAQSLLGTLRNHHGIRRTSTRIILVGHSMGGCVAKRVCTLAHQDPTAADFAARVHSIFFLATPHRGADMAAILESMLAVTWGKKPYVSDLTPNSTALAAINDAFRHYAPKLRLWSFYETLPTRCAGAMSRIVVEKHSATLGYHNEEIAAMNADHRQICKFDTPADPNYKVLRNALLTAVDTIRAREGTDLEPESADLSERAGGFSTRLPRASELSMSPAEINSVLRLFLGAGESLEGDLATLQVLKQPGSCKWLTERTAFASWRAGTAPGMLWLVGRPGAGKSVLAGHVVEQLDAPHTYCSYFICKHGSAGESTLSDCFRSIAFQMATQDESVGRALLQLARDGLVWDKTDDTSVWRRLFTGCIFKLQSLSRHYWVVDGVDECANFNALFTKRLLATLPSELRLFATSRNLEEIERGLTSLGANRVSIQALSDSDTIEDMRLFIMTRLTELGRPETADNRERMCATILSKSTGSFLWTRLVLQEFEDAWTEEAMEDILREIPEDLFELYSRMVHFIEADKRKLLLARSILTWVVLACRPLTVDEVRAAVKLDLNQTLQNAAKAIPDLCAQLTFVDQHGRVQLIHETAREFLLDDSLRVGLFIDRENGHAQLGSLLVSYLSSSVIMKPLQGKGEQGGGRSRGFAKPPVTAPSMDTSLIEYASKFFSEHLSRATSPEHRLMGDLAAFFRTKNVLSWIEHIAEGGDLTSLSTTAMNLREYLRHGMGYDSPTDPSFQLVDGWVTDLIRVAAKFCAELLTCPSSIHSLIPPLCPPDSNIAQAFARNPRLSSSSTSLVIAGMPPGLWDDCLVRMDFHEGRTMSVTHGERFFAIGLSTGQISLYDATSIQVLRQLQHPERIKLLQFCPEDVLLASCGMKHLMIWDSKNGTAVHSIPLRSSPLAITFLGVDEIIGAFRSCDLTKWYVWHIDITLLRGFVSNTPADSAGITRRDLRTEEHESISWRKIQARRQQKNHSALRSTIPSLPPSQVAFLTTPDDVLVALGYRLYPVCIVNAFELEILGTCEPDISNNGIDAMVFNPNPEIPNLIVCYQSGSLCVFDYLTMEMRVRQPDVHANCVACSADGRTIITGSNRGVIRIFELRQRNNSATVTFNTIYQMTDPLRNIVSAVAFNVDGMRFVDIRGQQGRVWAPAALVRKCANELENSTGTSEGRPPDLLIKPSGGMFDTSNNPDITTSLVVSADARFIVAGRANGEVVLFSAIDGAQVGVLYQHARGASILYLEFVESLTRVISVDIAGRVLVVDLRVTLSQISTTEQPEVSIVLDRRFGGAVAGVVINSIGDRVVILRIHHSKLWDLSSDTVYMAGGDIESASSGLQAPTPSPSLRPASHSPGVSDDTKTMTPDISQRSAFQHPSSPAWFVVVIKDVARIYAWADFSEVTTAEGIRLERHAQAKQPSSTPAMNTVLDLSTASYTIGPGFVVELFRPSPSSPAQLYLWPASQLDPSSGTTVAHPAVKPNLDAISPAVSDVLCVMGTSTLLFLDVKRWICSVELQSVSAAPPATVAFRTSGFGAPSASAFRTLVSSSLSSRLNTRATASAVAEPAAQARRHFFALSEWRPDSGRIRCSVAIPGRSPSGSRDVVAFVVGSKVVVVHGGLDFSVDVALVGTGTSKYMSTTAGEFVGGAFGQNLWQVVSGSMHRRSSNW